MNLLDYRKEIESMTLDQLHILRINHLQEVTRTEKKEQSLKYIIDDERHPERLKAKYQAKQAKDNIKFIDMCIRAKENK